MLEIPILNIFSTTLIYLELGYHKLMGKTPTFTEYSITRNPDGKFDCHWKIIY